MVTKQGFDRIYIDGAYTDFASLSKHQKLLIVLGKRTGSRTVESGIDSAVKIYLRKSWLRRNDIREGVNEALGRSDS